MQQRQLAFPVRKQVYFPTRKTICSSIDFFGNEGKVEVYPHFEWGTNEESAEVVEIFRQEYELTNPVLIVEEV